MRCATALNTSSGVLPAPAPRPAAEPSMRVAPASMAASEFAMPIAMLWWPWKPISVSGLSAAAQGTDARRHVLREHVAGRVGAVDAVGAVALHELAPAAPVPRASTMCAIMRKPTVSRPSLRERCDVLLGDVRLGAVGCDAHGRHAALVGQLQVLDGADPRQQQGGHPGALELRDHRAQVFLVAVRRKAVVDRGAAQAVAVRHLDERHAGRVQARWRRPPSAPG